MMAKENTVRRSWLKIDPADNVMVALTDLASGTVVTHEGREFVLLQNVNAKHKFFVRDMAQGEDVIMYGALVGKTQKMLLKGSLMTTSNTSHAASAYAYRGFFSCWQSPDISRFKDRTFKGYRRSDGRVGTANYWLFVPMVFCENRNLDVIREALQEELGYARSEKYHQFTRQLIEAYETGKDMEGLDLGPSPVAKKRYFPHVDGIKFLNHSGGCGGTQQDAATLSSLLAAYADHPNVGGVTVLSLGCQHLQMEYFLKDLKARNPGFDKPIFLFEQQKSTGEEALIVEAIRKTFLGLVQINELKREAFSLGHLSLGVKCGGSDGFSGISANPAVGYCADLLVALGGKVLLAEFPELCGAEQNILDRCLEEKTAGKFLRLMEAYAEEASKAGSGFHMNPSPGNIKDGLITDAIKSMGAVKKGGTSPVVDVLDYTESAIKSGLSLVCTPGNDVEATTGKAAAGANLILFTTGLGTPTGNPVVPTIKIATNSGLAERMKDIIDLDAGPVIKGEKSIEQMGEEILEYCLHVASGEAIPKAVLLGQDDFIPWKRGVSL